MLQSSCMPRLALLVKQLHNGRYFISIVRVECSRRKVAYRRHTLYLSRRHVRDLYWSASQPDREVFFKVNRLCVCPDDRRHKFQVTRLEVVATRVDDLLWLWITAHRWIPPHIDLSSVLLLGCRYALVVLVPECLFNVQDLAPLEQLL